MTGRRKGDEKGRRGGGKELEERNRNVQHTCTVIITGLAAVLRKWMLHQENAFNRLE